MPETPFNPSQSFGDLVKQIVRKAKPSKKTLSRRKKAQQILKEMLGPRSAHATVVSVKVGVVTIEADGAALFQELEGYLRQALIERLREAGQPVNEVRVRLPKA